MAKLKPWRIKQIICNKIIDSETRMENAKSREWNAFYSWKAEWLKELLFDIEKEQKNLKK